MNDPFLQQLEQVFAKLQETTVFNNGMAEGLKLASNVYQQLNFPAKTTEGPYNTQEGEADDPFIIKFPTDGSLTPL